MENLQLEPALAWTFRHRSRLSAAIVPKEVELLLVRSISVKQVGRRVLVKRDQEELTVVVSSLNPAELDITARRVRCRVADDKHRDLMLPGGFGGFDLGSVAAGWTVRAGIVAEDVLVGEVIRLVKTCVEDAYHPAAVVERLGSLREDPDTLGGRTRRICATCWVPAEHRRQRGSELGRQVAKLVRPRWCQVSC